MSLKSGPRPSELRNIYRFGLFVLVLAFGMVALTARMSMLQLAASSQSPGISGVRATERQPIPSTRGLIYDASGDLLASNVTTYTVTLIPADLPLQQEPVVATRLGAVLDMDPIYIETLIDSATGSLYLPITIAENVDVDLARFIQENADALPGVSVMASQKRQYLEGSLFSDVVGYTGQITAQQYAAWKSLGYSDTDIVGQAGVENSYESVLRGTYGYDTVAVDDAGKPQPGLVTPGAAAIPGSSLHLTISKSVQADALAALSWGLAATHVTSGTIIVENPQNGEILAMVSLPTYNDQDFANGISEAQFQQLLTDPGQPLLNKAIGAQYAPGSTYKLVTGTAGLQDQAKCTSRDATGQIVFSYCNGAFNASTTLLSQPKIEINGYPYTEWNNVGWGPLNIYGGFAHSSDTFFYQLSRMVGMDRLAYWGRQYGFGQPTGIDLPGEAVGIVPDEAWAQQELSTDMYIGDVLHEGIGQGYDAATALQLLDAYCAMANGGNLWQPHVVKSITAPDGTVQEIQPTLLNKLPASQQTLETMRLAAREVVTSRHTYNLVDLPVKVAGKTGTAEFGVPDRNGYLPYHEWFVGFTPGDPYNGDFTKPDSQLAVVAFIYGADSLGNVATEVVKYFMMRHYHTTRYPFSTSTPGYIIQYLAHKTNFYNFGVRD
jgi:penicillin-binding protein 2